MDNPHGSRAGRWRLERFWAKGSRGIALRPIRPRGSALPGQFLGPDLLVVVVVAGQRGEKGHEIVDISLAEGEGLYILVEERVL